MNNTPTLVICCLAYNHERYIRDALEGFVMQKTDFPFVAIVHDDASTDGTADIIREYAAKYPHIIKPIFETENQYSKGDGSIRRIVGDALRVVGAKYIAMCEGDDYWTDPHKLQKQVSYLDTHPDIVYTCHNYEVITDKGEIIGKSDSPFYIQLDEDGQQFSLKDAFEREWFTKTLTSVFRADVYFKMDLSKYERPRDTHMVYELLREGNGYYFKFYGGCYRLHEGGVCSMIPKGIRMRQSWEIWEDIYKKCPCVVSKKALMTNYGLYVIFSIRNERRLRFPASVLRFQSLAYLPIMILKILYKHIKH